MEFKSIYQIRLIDNICNRLTPGNPILAVGKSNTGKKTALAFSAIDFKKNIIVLCAGIRDRDQFMNLILSILNKRGQHYITMEKDYIQISKTQCIKCYPIGNSTIDVFIDDGFDYIFFTDAHKVHPMTLRCLLDKLTHKNVVITSQFPIYEINDQIKNILYFK